MSLNLITDPWIPVRCEDGTTRVIAPWQMAEQGIAFPNWPRADLNIACLELLIGLVFLVDPPEDEEDWEDRQDGDPARLRARLDRFAEAFELLGDGPRFMQDFEPLQGAANAADMLFIDSAGGQTAKNNADLMVWRNRYPSLDLPMAAMALYTLQSFAPSGGAGNRTSMRGGGPMVTLLDPGGGLWPLIWANVPDGAPGQIGDLPWMKPTRTSEATQEVFPQQAPRSEAFFGMPRRLRLQGDKERVTGVVQRPYGTNYTGWVHPLSPYYRMKIGAELLPKHPGAGAFGYRQWLGVTVAESGPDEALTQRAAVVSGWHARSQTPVQVIVAGWAMEKMKPRDFIFARQPLLRLDEIGQARVVGMIRAANEMSLALCASLAPVVAEGEAREALREAFYLETQAEFERLVTASAVTEATARDWVAVMRRVALSLFEQRAFSDLSKRYRPVKDDKNPEKKAEDPIVQAYGRLRANLSGQGAYGKRAFDAMELRREEVADAR